MTTGPSEAVRDPYEAQPAPVELPLLIPRQRDAPPPAAPPRPPAPGPPAPAGLPGSAAQPEELPRPRWGLGAYLLVELVFLASSVLMVLPYLGHPRTTPLPASMLLLTLAVPTILSAATAVLITRLRGNGPRADLGLRFAPADLAWGLGFGFLGLVLSVPASLIWASAVGSERATSAVAEVFTGERFSVPVAAAMCLIMWLVAPVCEEIVYRGLLWGAVARLGGSRWWPLAVSTVLFALAHFEFTRTPLLLVIAVPIGLARMYSKGLGASIVAHQINNFLPAVSLFLMLVGAAPAP